MRQIRSIAYAAGAILLLGSSAWADTLYLEPFTSGATVNPSPASTFSWHAYSGVSTATDISSTAAFYTGEDVKSPPTGTNVPSAVNTNDPGTTVSYGFSASSFPNANTLLYGTPATTVNADGTSTSNQVVSWYQFDRNNTTSSVRPAIEVGGTFYVYNVASTTTGNQAAGTGGFGDPTSAVLQSAALSSPKWQPITLTVGSALSYNSATALQALPSGAIQGLGWYYNAGGANLDVRLDDFTLSTTPEPGFAGALAFGGLLMRRRARRALTTR